MTCPFSGDESEALIRWVRSAEAALLAIAAMPDEDNEWDGRDKFREARAIASNALKE